MTERNTVAAKPMLHASFQSGCTISDWAVHWPPSSVQSDLCDGVNLMVLLSELNSRHRNVTLPKWTSTPLLHVHKYVALRLDSRGLLPHDMLSRVESVCERSEPTLPLHWRCCDRVENCRKALDFIAEEGIKLVNIGPTDVVEGNVKLCFALLLRLMAHYHFACATTISEAEAELLRWLRCKLAPQPVDGFAKCWADGVLLNALIRRLCADVRTSVGAEVSAEHAELSVALSERPVRDLRGAVAKASDLLRIPALSECGLAELEASAAGGQQDSKALIVYLAYFRGVDTGEGCSRLLIWYATKRSHSTALPDAEPQASAACEGGAHVSSASSAEIDGVSEPEATAACPALAQPAAAEAREKVVPGPRVFCGNFCCNQHSLVEKVAAATGKPICFICNKKVKPQAEFFQCDVRARARPPGRLSAL